MRKLLQTIVLANFIICANAQKLKSFERNNVWGYKDSFGNVAIAPKYDYARDFLFGYGIVLKNDSVGAIDKNDHIVIPFKYNFLRPLDSSEFEFGYRAKYFGEYNRGVMTIDQKIKIPCIYRDITKRRKYYEVSLQKDSAVSGALHSVTSTYGLLDSDGVPIIPCEFSHFSWLNDSVIDLSNGRNHALFTDRGRQLTEFIYLVIGSPDVEGFCKVRVGDQYGFIGLDGRVEIPVELNFCEEFQHGVSVAQKKKWGAIDKRGKWVIKPKYNYQKVKELVRKKYFK